MGYLGMSLLKINTILNEYNIFVTKSILHSFYYSFMSKAKKFPFEALLNLIIIVDYFSTN
jgi:hypothetical protein